MTSIDVSDVTNKCLIYKNDNSCDNDIIQRSYTMFYDMQNMIVVDWNK